MDIDLYRKLFVNRADVFAQQFSDGHYEPVPRELEDWDIEEHLGGMSSFGTYVIMPQSNTVTYVVFDLDTYDPSALQFLCDEVERLVTEGCNEVTAEQAVHSLVLEASGGKGFHIWCFFDGEVAARDARLWAAPVKDAYDKVLHSSDLCDWPALEVFPKQDYVAEGGYGNLVKLPLGVHAKSGKRSEILSGYGAGSLDKVQRLRASLVPAAPEATRAHLGDGGRTAPFACISKLIEDGAPQGCRDKAMFHFCHYAFGTGLPDDMVHEWAERVNTGFDPPLTDNEVDTKVRSASGMASPHPGCGADWLRDFCPGGENCFAPWNDRGNKPRRESVQTLDDDDSYEAWERRNR